MGTRTAADTFAELFTYDLPLDYFSTLPERINAVTIEQAQAMAQKYILPDKMIVLAVGDRAKIGENSCASRNFCGGKSILKRGRRKKNDGSRFIELRGRISAETKRRGEALRALSSALRLIREN